MTVIRTKNCHQELLCFVYSIVALDSPTSLFQNSYHAKQINNNWTKSKTNPRSNTRTQDKPLCREYRVWHWWWYQHLVCSSQKKRPVTILAVENQSPYQYSPVCALVFATQGIKANTDVVTSIFPHLSLKVQSAIVHTAICTHTFSDICNAFYHTWFLSERNTFSNGNVCCMSHCFNTYPESSLVYEDVTTQGQGSGGRVVGWRGGGGGGGQS